MAIRSVDVEYSSKFFVEIISRDMTLDGMLTNGSRDLIAGIVEAL